MKKLIFISLVLVLISVFLVVANNQVARGTAVTSITQGSQGCQNLRIGVVGASNMVRRGFQTELKRLCPGSEVVINAEGGRSPAYQVDNLLPNLLNLNLNVLIISPSGNGVCNTQQQHVEPTIQMLTQAKALGIRTVVLGVSPRPTNLNCVKSFNNNLIINKLGRHDLIDNVVDVYELLKDVNNENDCTILCEKDLQRHWNSAGSRKVAQAVQGVLSSEISTVTQPQQTATVSQCQNCICIEPVCNEIDNVWTQIASFVDPIHSSKIWDPGAGWTSPPVVSTVTTPGQKSPVGNVPLSGQLSVILTGQHCLNEQKITEILSSSPLVDHAGTILAMSDKYKIKEEIFLAMVKKESNYATAGAGSNSFNPSNIRPTSCQTCSWRCDQIYNAGSSGNFCNYQTWERGIESWFALIARGNPYVAGGKTTVDEIIPTYCPPEDCVRGDPTAPQKYVDFVKETVKSYDCQS
jgi:hypothetical protein